MLKPYTLLEKIDEDSVAAACFYAERHDVPIVLAGLPETIFR